MPGGPRKSASSCCVDEVAGGELEDEAAVHLLVEVEVEGVEGLVRRRGSCGVLDAAFEEAIAAARELVGDERGEEVDRGHLARLCACEEPGLEAVRPCRRGGAGEARRCSSTRFISSSSLVMWLMRSRYWVSSRISGSIWRSVSGTGGWRSR